MASEAVAQPAITGIGASVKAEASSGVVPGLTRKVAPAAIVASICARLVTVPAPAMAPSTSAAISRSASSATGVRSVTSISGRPPSTSARASGTASSRRSMTTTGTTGALATKESGLGRLMGYLR